MTAALRPTGSVADSWCTRLSLVQTTAAALSREGLFSRSWPILGEWFDLPSVENDPRASNVHAMIRVALDDRLPLYARKAHTQCPRQQSIACTPVARAIQSAYKDLFVNRLQKLTTCCLTPSPSVNSVLKVRTLQTRVSCVAVIKLRLEASCRNGVPTLCPVFSGLQTGSCS